MRSTERCVVGRRDRHRAKGPATCVVLVLLEEESYRSMRRLLRPSLGARQLNQVPAQEDGHAPAQRLRAGKTHAVKRSGSVITGTADCQCWPRGTARSGGPA